jgi:predicted exporter
VRLPFLTNPVVRTILALLLLALLGLALFRAVPIRTEMSDLLPPGQTPAAEFLLRELRSGAATTVLLAGIEGASEEELARISREVGNRLRESERFSFIGNGSLDLSDEERELIFRYRYLLSPSTEPVSFQTDALKAKLAGLIEGLRSSASPLLARFGFADPTGAFFDLLRGWLGQSRVQLRSGIWFAGETPNPRALIVARSNTSGLDTEAQAAAMQAFRQAFAAANPGPAKLLLSGPGVFGAEAAATVHADVEMISVLSGMLILGFLWLRYRSLLMLLVVAVPLLAASLSGVAAVGLMFGTVHAAALGFGMTMLGVVVDYPLLLITQRRPGESLRQTARRIWPTLRLAAEAAALGLTGMMASGFPMLAQLGLFGAAGLLVGVMATAWVLPWLLQDTALAPRRLPGPLLRGLGFVRGRRAVALVVPAAALFLALSGGVRWEDDLARLSPVPQAQRDLDEQLRHQLGAPDVGGVVVLNAPDAEAVLRQAEMLGDALDTLVAQGVLSGFDSPTRYLPSAARQQTRQASLPAVDIMAPRLEQAAAGLPFRPEAFQRFLQSLAESHALPALTVADLPRLPTLAARLSPLLSAQGEGWQGLIIPQELRDKPALQAALAGLSLPGALWVDIKAEMEGIVTVATRQALLWCGLGGLAVLVLLAIGLGRRPGEAWKQGVLAALWTAAPILGAMLVTLAALMLMGQRLTPFHLVALLLAAGVGMDYALFFGTTARQGEDEAERTLGAIFNCTITTLLTFGLLALCATPVLRGIGLTVAVGVLSAFVLALSLSPRPASPLAVGQKAPN